MVSEKIRLLGANVYTDIPGELTLKALPTVTELEYVSAEDFESTMIEKILPQAVEEKINFKDLLEIDFYWICRCLRIMNYGPYFTTNAVYCPKCGMTYGEYRVNLNTVGCKPLPDDFKNEIVINGDEFVDFDKDITLRLPTIQDILNAYKDKAFLNGEGKINKDLSRACYMITKLGEKTSLNAVEKKLYILNNLSSADYIVLKDRIAKLTDYGLRAGGVTQCPKCKGMHASFYALIDDKFFFPTLGDLREWKNDRSRRSDEDLSGSSTETV